MNFLRAFTRQPDPAPEPAGRGSARTPARDVIPRGDSLPWEEELPWTDLGQAAPVPGGRIEPTGFDDWPTTSATGSEAGTGLAPLRRETPIAPARPAAEAPPRLDAIRPQEPALAPRAREPAGFDDLPPWEEAPAAPAVPAARIAPIASSPRSVSPSARASEPTASAATAPVRPAASARSAPRPAPDIELPTLDIALPVLDQALPQPGEPVVRDTAPPAPQRSRARTVDVPPAQAPLDIDIPLLDLGAVVEPATPANPPAPHAGPVTPAAPVTPTNALPPVAERPAAITFRAAPTTIAVPTAAAAEVDLALDLPVDAIAPRDDVTPMASAASVAASAAAAGAAAVSMPPAVEPAMPAIVPASPRARARSTAPVEPDPTPTPTPTPTATATATTTDEALLAPVHRRPAAAAAAARARRAALEAGGLPTGAAARAGAGQTMAGDEAPWAEAGTPGWASSRFEQAPAAPAAEAAAEGALELRLVQLASRALMALAFTGLLAWALVWAARGPWFAFKRLTLEGPLDHVSAQALRTQVLPQLRGGYFTMDLQAARAAFETSPWVRKAQVRRVWPDRLVVAIEEHRPRAVWEREGDEDQLVDAQGQVFDASVSELDDSVAEDLPVLRGPAGSGAQMLAMVDRLAPLWPGLNTELTRLELSERGSWRATLASKAVIELGRGEPAEVAERTARFIATVGEVSARFGRRAIESADLRHQTGYALKLVGVGTSSKPVAGGAARKP